MADNETNISLSFKNNVSGTTKLDKYATQLERIYGVVSALDKGQNKVLVEVQRSSNKTTKAMQETEKATKRLGNQFKTAFSIAGITAFTHAATKLFNNLSKMSTKSSEYVENINLLEVAYHNANETIEESSQRIETFIDKMAEMYGFDESRLTRQFGIFKQLANAMELPVQEGERLSEIMVKMTNDVASLYNLDLARASNALQSALVGQTRPIRGATGADITEKTLQRTVDALGLDREISQLSFVEKRLIMVISLTNQLKVSQGDYARTIESASNQIRVMKEQWDRLSRAVGNVFYPILQKILPYINGVLMALTEIFNLLAALLGFEMPEFDYSSLSGTSDAALDLMENLDGASDSVDKLSNKMKGLRNFDKLNVINTPSSSGGGVSGGVGASGIDPKIMSAFNKAFEQYDDLMGSVRMKARDIRDSIMEWLGFTKKINPLTGEIEWEYQGISKTLSNMFNSFMKLNPLVKAFVLVGVGKALKSIWDWGSKAYTSLSSISKILLGATGVVVGLKLTYDAFTKIRNEGPNLINVLEGVGGALSSIAGGAMIGASIGGGWGALIGGISGGIVSLTAALIALGQKRDVWGEFLDSNQKKLDSFTDSLKEQYRVIEEQASFDMTKNTLASKLVSQLEEITEANGRVKQGYEDRATFIINDLNKAYGLEIKMIDGVIQNYGNQIKSLKQVIETEKQKIYVQMAEEKYSIAIKNQAKAEEELNTAIAQRRSILNDTTLSEEERIRKLKLANEQVKQANKAVEMNQKAISNYEGLTTAIIQNNTKAIEEYEKKVELAYNDLETSVEDYYVASAQTYANYWQTNLNIIGKKYEELDETQKEFVDRQINGFITMFKKGVEETGEISDEMVYAWKTMAEESEDAFIVAFNKLPDDLKQKLASKMQGVGKDIVEKAQQGINSTGGLNLTAKIDKIQIPTSATDKLKSTISNALGVGLGNVFKANGGIFVNGAWKDVTAYAGGGTPPVGQMFMARENGPELVGQIGGHTAVMNNDQIVGSVANGVYQAVRSAMGTTKNNSTQVYNIYLDKNTKLATYVLDQLDDIAKSNGKPIEIGGY